MAAFPDIAIPPPGSRLRAAWNAGRRLPARFRFRFQTWTRPAALPLVLLLLALSALFLFGHDRADFYRYRWHDFNSAQTLAFAENLSFKHNLLIYRYQSRDADGNRQYQGVYNRFPLGGYVLVKLAILPFGETDFRAKTYAARMLMLLLFSAAVVLTYHALARITGSRWDALTATLLAFSSYYLLHYADKISNEVTIDLFAVMLAFHGMVIFVQEGRFRQLLVKSCVALLLGWHVYAFLLPFIAFGLIAELLKARRDISANSSMPERLKEYVTTLRRSRYLALGVVTLLFGVAVLSFQLGNEYFALDGDASLRETPSFRSAVRRLGWNESVNARRAVLLQPKAFATQQLNRIAQIALPYAVNPYAKRGSFNDIDYGAGVGVLALSVCLAGLVGLGLAGGRRLRGLRGLRPGALLLLGTLTVSGFCWAIPVRLNVVFHDFESVFFIGIPLTAAAVILLGLRKLSRVRLAPLYAVAALAVFVFSASAMAGIGKRPAEMANVAERLNEYAAIRELTRDDSATIYLQWYNPGPDDGMAWAWAYFLAGATLLSPSQPAPLKPPQAGDYLLLHLRQDNPTLLTPEHRHIFLYEWSPDTPPYRIANLNDPVIAADWQVHLSAGRLTYVDAECSHLDEFFYLHLIPGNPADLPAVRQEYGYENADFRFDLYGGVRIDGTCVIERPLPHYDIAAIRTGQYTDAGPIWTGEYALPAR